MVYGYRIAQIVDLYLFTWSWPSKYGNIRYLCLCLTPISEGGGWKRGKRSTSRCSVVVRIVFLRFDSQLSFQFLIRMTLISFSFLLPLPFSPFYALLYFSSLYLSLSSLPLSPFTYPFSTLSIQHTSGQLQIYQARIETGRSTKIWKVEGVATVELDGCCMYVFDCNTTLNNGSGVRWTRLDGSNGLRERPLTNGKRLDAEGLLHQHLGNYLCWDERTAERLILRINDSKNTDIFSDSLSAGSILHEQNMWTGKKNNFNNPHYSTSI